MRYLLLFSICFLLASCQTNMARQFDKISPGMDKDAVLDKLGSPRHITRMNGEDRWYYLYYQEDVRQQKEIHFKDGLVSYSGEKKKPVAEIDPVVVDTKNSEINRQLDEETEKRKTASKNAYNDYLKYEKKVKKENEIQYLPDFEPLQ